MSITIILLILALPIVFAGGYIIKAYLGKLKLNSAETKSQKIIDEATRDAEAKRKELLIEAKDQILKERNLFDKEMRERRQELQNIEKKHQLREESIDKRDEQFKRREKILGLREQENQEREDELKKELDRHRKELERISNLSTKEARKLLFKSLENEVRFESQKFIVKIEEEAKLTADKKAKEAVLSAIQRCASEFTSESTITTVTLPSDDMKGRIIGREGRNIRTLENLTGVDMIIDDTPEVVVISGFDPMRREIAKISLERLIHDGRIHPAIIEEVVNKVTNDIEKNMLEEGEKAAFELGIPGFVKDALYAVGKLKYRSSYGQNVLSHSKEVANLAGIMASELGLDVQVAKRGGLLHDIGKGVETEGEGAHAIIGADLARRFGEGKKVENIIASHHNDKEAESYEAILVQVADTISASRPGARRESIDTYVKRLENLEAIASSFKGVEKCFAIQAGREIRVMVENELVNDERAEGMAREIAKKIEAELKYPGIVKVTVIRETRVIEYAR